MRVVIAPDSFKECASARRVADCIATGLHRAWPTAELDRVPMADGGEGTVDALVAATDGTFVTTTVTGPLGESVDARWGLLGDRSTAVIEMAAASGLALVPRERRDPRYTTTRGTGELIAAALEMGVLRIVIGIGGSATNDGGAGMAQALGYSLQDADGNELGPGGAALVRLARIGADNVHPALSRCEILVACDVANPLCGPEGASYVYGPQKGASPETIEELDLALRRFAEVVKAQLGKHVADVPGSGAAGGLGAGLIAFARGTLRSGVDVVAQACRLDERVRRADLVITGEGRLDAQTAQGKTPAGVARIAKRHGVPVIAISGALGTGFKSTYKHGIDAAFSICPRPMSLEEARASVEELLADAAESIARVWTISRRGT
ncbi:MAG: glycerate kinase [Candidatus Hydrogenedentota bacterium]